MKRGIKHISIPQPCAQNWADMEAVEHGRFCQSCQQTVVDFTRLSNEQIFDALSSNGKVCGRFDQRQLTAANSEIHGRVPRFSWRSVSIATVFIGLVPFVKAEAKTKTTVEQTSRDVKTKAPLFDTVTGPRVIKGQITSATDKLPLPGASVRLKGLQIATATDANGNFMLYIPPNTKVSAGVIAYIGFETKEFFIDEKVTQYPIALKEASNMLTGEIVVVKRPPLWKRPYYSVKRFFHKIFS